MRAAPRWWSGRSYRSRPRSTTTSTAPTEELFAEIDRLTAANAAAPDRDAERRLRLSPAPGRASARWSPARATARATRSRMPGRCRRRRAARDRREGPDAGPAARGHPARRLRAGPGPGAARRRARGSPTRSTARSPSASVCRPPARPRTATTRSSRRSTPYDVAPGARPWIQEGGGVLAADAPILTAEMLRDVRRTPACRSWWATTWASGRWSRCRRPRCARPTRRRAAPGTRTARSWARCGR